MWSNPASTTFGSEFITDQAGDYVLSETTVDGYTNGTWSCGGAPLTNMGLFSGATVTVGLGDTITLMFP